MVAGTFPLSAGTLLTILVGQRGWSAQDAAGGGGGSFVAMPDDTLLLAAGGGGGSSGLSAANSGDGSADPNGGNGFVSATSTFGGVGGSGGGVSINGKYATEGSGGGGYAGNGEDDPLYPNVASTGGRAFLKGGAGGTTPPASPVWCASPADGGFGGGGSGTGALPECCVGALHTR
jgi:hypothetical protein